MNVFGGYANYYNLLYQDKDYQSEADYIYSLIARHAPGSSSVLELGCGTGKHALLLAGKGLVVHGVDMSPVMLAQAKQQVSNASAEIAGNVSFAHGDVRTYRCERSFDVCVSLFHVMSYQVSNEDLRAAFLTTSEHLKPGGIFIFDYWYGPSVLTQRPEVRVKRLEDDQIEIMRVAEPIVYPNENRVRVNYSVWIENKRDSVLQKVRESHDMRYLFLPEIEFISQSWFNVVKHYGWLKNESPSLDDWAGLSVLVRHR